MNPPHTNEYERYLSERDAAELLGMSPRTLQAWRSAGTGPAFRKVSDRCVRYRISDLHNWMATFLAGSPREEGAHEGQERTTSDRNEKGTSENEKQ
jgi:predicted DNA-binding transcriptional regulator AlpA